jgi:hypothetical protein
MERERAVGRERGVKQKVVSAQNFEFCGEWTGNFVEGMEGAPRARLFIMHMEPERRGRERLESKRRRVWKDDRHKDRPVFTIPN